MNISMKEFIVLMAFLTALVALSGWVVELWSSRRQSKAHDVADTVDEPAATRN